MTNDVAEKILEEIKSLRRDISLLIPSESLDEYDNVDEILRAYKSAQKESELPVA